MSIKKIQPSRGPGVSRGETCDRCRVRHHNCDGTAAEGTACYNCRRMHYHPCSFIRNPGPAPPLPPNFINPADLVKEQMSDLARLGRLRISDTSDLNNGQVRPGAANAARALLAESLSATAIPRPRRDNNVSRAGSFEAILSQCRDLSAGICPTHGTQINGSSSGQANDDNNNNNSSSSSSSRSVSGRTRPSYSEEDFLAQQHGVPIRFQDNGGRPLNWLEQIVFRRDPEDDNNNSNNNNDNNNSNNNNDDNNNNNNNSSDGHNNEHNNDEPNGNGSNNDSNKDSNGAI